MSEPTTEAGKRLLDEEWDNFDVRPWGSLADHVDAIEAEARDETIKALLAYAGDPDPALSYAVLSRVLARVELVICAAERARLRAAVEALAVFVPGAYAPLMEDGTDAGFAECVSRAAVLALLEVPA